MTAHREVLQLPQESSRLAAEIVADGHALMEAVEYGELEAPDGKGYKVTWYVENQRRA